MGLAASMGSQAASMGLGWVDQTISGAIGAHYGTRQALLNYQLGEQAAQNADWRQRQQYQDMYSISAQMRELKKAGLSPSLLYGDVPSVQGASGAQGSGASGISAALGSPTNLAANAQAQLAIAEARKADVEADVLEGKNPRGDAEIKEILQRTGNLWLQGEYTAIQNELASLDLAIKSEYGFEQAKASLENLQASTNNLRATLQSLVARGKIDEESADAIIAYNRGKVIEQLANITYTRIQSQLAEHQIALTDKQIEKIISDIAVNNTNIEVSRRGVKVKEDELQAQIEQWLRENGLQERGQNIEIAKTIVNFWTTEQEHYMRVLDNLSPLNLLEKGANIFNRK